MTAKKTGEMISEKRKSLGMTQKQLAALVQVSDKAVSKWERGECFPDITIAPKLAEIFGISMEVLLGLEDVTADRPERQEEKRNALVLNNYNRRLLQYDAVVMAIFGFGFFISRFFGLPYNVIFNVGFLLLAVVIRLICYSRQTSEREALETMELIPPQRMAVERYSKWLFGGGVLLSLIYFFKTLLERFFIWRYLPGSGLAENKNMILFDGGGNDVVSLLLFVLVFGAHFYLLYRSHELLTKGAVSFGKYAFAIVWVVVPTLVFGALLSHRVYLSVTDWSMGFYQNQPVKLLALATAALLLLLMLITAVVWKKFGKPLAGKEVVCAMMSVATMLLTLHVSFVPSENVETNVFSIVYTGRFFIGLFVLSLLLHLLVWQSFKKSKNV